MGIELSSSMKNAKVLGGVEGVKDKNKSRDDVESPDEGGFSSVLTSIDSTADEVEDANVSAKPKGKLNPVDVLPSSILSDPALLVPPEGMKLQVQAANEVMSDVSMPAASAITSEMAMLLAQAGEMSGKQMGKISDAVPVGTRSVRVGMPKSDADTPLVSARALATLGTEKLGDFKKNNIAVLEESTSSLLGQARNVRVAELQSAAAANLVESRALHQSLVADAMMDESALAGALQSSDMQGEVLGQKEGIEATLPSKIEGGGVDAVWGQHVLQAGSHADDPKPITDTAMLTPEQTVADTVSYWVTQGVQNAELTLDGFGGDSIGVSISLKGDEARINFRTDQPEIRQILEGAVAHLKELLSSEGLVLSGVSVGGLGQEGAGAQDRRNQPDVRQATFATQDAGVAENQPRVIRPVGKGLDIYV